MRLLSVIVLFLLSALPAWADCAQRTIAHNVLGAPVCVPQSPARIVVMDPFYDLGMALELGAPVVAAPLIGIPDTNLQARAREASLLDLGDAKQPSLERVVAAWPDLIIGDAQLHARIAGQLRQIAPTALIRSQSWKEHLTTLAGIVGRQEAADRALAGYEDRVASIRARLREEAPDTTVSIIRIAPHGFHVYLDGPRAYAPYAVLHEAGVRRTDYETTEGDEVLKRPDWEEVAALDGDVLLYVVAAGNAPGADAALEKETTANPFWQMLPAVAAGRAHRVDKAPWFGFNSVASAHRILDDVERYILTAP